MSELAVTLRDRKNKDVTPSPEKWSYAVDETPKASGRWPM